MNFFSLFFEMPFTFNDALFFFTCAGVAVELVTKATDTPVAPRRVVTAPAAAGNALALVHI